MYLEKTSFLSYYDIQKYDSMIEYDICNIFESSLDVVESTLVGIEIMFTHTDWND